MRVPALAVALATAACAQTLPSLSIPWASVPESPEALTVPPGCTCLDLDQSPCTRFDCTCTCDLTAGSCDANCCCDAECPAEATASARAADTCLPEGPSSLAVLTCVEVGEASQLAAINTKARMFLVDAANRGLEGVVCVAVDNSPYAGSFLSDPGLPGAAVFSRTDVAADPTFVESAEVRALASLRTATAAVAPGLYLPGQPVLAARASGSSLSSSGGGVLRLPGPALGGGCADAVVALAQQPGKWSCSQPAPVTAAQCAALTPAARLGTLRVAALPTAPVSDPASALWLAPNATSLFEISASTGAATNATAATTAAILVAPQAGDTSVAGRAGTFAAEGGGTGTCSCEGVLVGYDAAIASDGQGKLTKVTFDVRVATLTGLPCSAGAATGNASAAAGAAFSLAGSVAYTASAEASSAVTTSLELNNIVARSRSGNPGYVAGSPVQAGVLTSDPTPGSSKTAVLAATDGLQLVGPGSGGACAVTGGAAASGPASTKSVRFGEDVVVGCSLSLTPAELEALCTAAGAASLPGVVLGLAGGLTHVGMMGNADPLRSTHWLAISETQPSASPTWDAASLTCQGMLVGFEVRLLAAPVGEAANPQRKIIAAATRYITGDLTAASAAGATAFALTSSVSFASLGASGLDRFIPPPPSVIALPHDLFYPFQINDIALAAAPAQSSPAGAMLAVAAAVLLLAAPRAAQQ
ncbi:hypothetical protein FNF31_00814 [Cafeteria roenbergensis]|uniref:Tectonic-1-3 N-terminal domain-containing protein n=1 Tax=Cafeteria roenbergensis TaxID=33653 RepID=A0A5A8D2V7_CAFRO|nr:hypothetical protein FNF28_06287 [Cafeteria roenbergensis]KAA0167879.1 hypothetical protein FNF31_00814 [Cafeteria roenbergensis]